MSCFFEKRRGPEHKFLVPVLTIGPDATSACIASRARARILALQTHGRLAQLTKCDRMPLAVSLEPQRQPQSIRRPGGRPRLAFAFLRVGPHDGAIRRLQAIGRRAALRHLRHQSRAVPHASFAVEHNSSVEQNRLFLGEQTAPPSPEE